MTEAKPAGYTGTWNPDIYLRFATYRARPAQDLLQRLTLDVAGDIYDLGCGPGTLTKQLKDRWPDRRVIGVDSSAEMLADARKQFGADAIAWQAGNVATWQAERPAALVFSNAVLHWLADHATLVPRLMQQVAPGGLLAIQMPMTGQAKYHACLRAVKNSPRWRERLAHVDTHHDPHPAGFYYDLLTPLAAEIDVWETNYNHVLTGDHPVTAWLSGTGMVPILSVLDETEKAAFIADYDMATDAAFARQIDGAVLLDMQRLFIVAKRAG